jgi:hypothetical protein
MRRVRKNECRTFFGREQTMDGVLIGEWIVLTTYTHHLELRVITAQSPISTIHKSLHAKSSPACSVSSSRAQVLLSRFQYRTDSQLVAPVLFFITPRRGPRRQHPVSPTACVVAAGKCLPSRYIAAAVVLLFVSRSLLSNGPVRHSIVIHLKTPTKNSLFWLEQSSAE